VVRGYGKKSRISEIRVSFVDCFAALADGRSEPGISSDFSRPVIPVAGSV